MFAQLEMWVEVTTVIVPSLILKPVNLEETWNISHGVTKDHLGMIFIDYKLALHRACIFLAKIISLLTFFSELLLSNIDRIVQTNVSEIIHLKF